MGRPKRGKVGAGGAGAGGIGEVGAGRLPVLVSAEPRAYGGAIARAVRSLRPRPRVREVEPGTRGREVTRPDPAPVICSRPEVGELAGCPAFVEYRPYEKPAAKVRFDDRYQELDEVGLEDLLRVADEIELLTGGHGTEVGRTGRKKNGRLADEEGADGVRGGARDCDRDNGAVPTPDAGTPDGGA